MQMFKYKVNDHLKHHVESEVPGAQSQLLAHS